MWMKLTWRVAAARSQPRQWPPGGLYQRTHRWGHCQYVSDKCHHRCHHSDYGSSSYRFFTVIMETAPTRRNKCRMDQITPGWSWKQGHGRLRLMGPQVQALQLHMEDSAPSDSLRLSLALQAHFECVSGRFR